MSYWQSYIRTIFKVNKHSAHTSGTKLPVVFFVWYLNLIIFIYISICNSFTSSLISLNFLFIIICYTQIIFLIGTCFPLPVNCASQRPLLGSSTIHVSKLYSFLSKAWTWNCLKTSSLEKKNPKLLRLIWWQINSLPREIHADITSKVFQDLPSQHNEN